MPKIQKWANFCPKKHYWELKQLPEYTDLPEHWWQAISTIKKELQLLKKAGIQGLRLNIFNIELTSDGESINWDPLDTFLELAHKLEIDIHLCIGPYQYPFWPGIRLPPPLLTEKKFSKIIDQNKKWKEFGTAFLEEQLKRYSKSKLISGFYLGNEWDTTQRIESLDQKSTTFTVSSKHMQSLSRLCKKHTRKPIFFNTNWDAYHLKQIEHIFLPLFNVLKNQAWIGFDIYPSQIYFAKYPRLTIHRKFHSFKSDVELFKKKFTQRILITEFEAQPWGNGKSWFDQISKKPNFTQDFSQTLTKTFAQYFATKQFETITLWGAEFWLVAYHMGHTEMLDTVSAL